MYCPNCGSKLPLQPVERRVLEDGDQAYPMVSFTLVCEQCGAQGDIDFMGEVPTILPKSSDLTLDILNGLRQKITSLENIIIDHIKRLHKTEILEVNNADSETSTIKA